MVLSTVYIFSVIQRLLALSQNAHHPGPVHPSDTCFRPEAQRPRFTILHPRLQCPGCTMRWQLFGGPPLRRTGRHHTSSGMGIFVPALTRGGCTLLLSALVSSSRRKCLRSVHQCHRRRCNGRWCPERFQRQPSPRRWHGRIRKPRTPEPSAFSEQPPFTCRWGALTARFFRRSGCRKDLVILEATSTSAVGPGACYELPQPLNDENRLSELFPLGAEHGAPPLQVSSRLRRQNWSGARRFT